MYKDTILLGKIRGGGGMDHASKKITACGE